jgi:hypothetical protein
MGDLGKTAIHASELDDEPWHTRPGGFCRTTSPRSTYSASGLIIRDMGDAVLLVCEAAEGVDLALFKVDVVRVTRDADIVDVVVRCGRRSDAGHEINSDFFPLPQYWFPRLPLLLDSLEAS